MKQVKVGEYKRYKGYSEKIPQRLISEFQKKKRERIRKRKYMEI